MERSDAASGGHVCGWTDHRSARLSSREIKVFNYFPSASMHATMKATRPCFSLKNKNPISCMCGLIFYTTRCGTLPPEDDLSSDHSSGRHEL